MAELLRLPRVARVCEHLDCHARMVPPRQVHLQPTPDLLSTASTTPCEKEGRHHMQHFVRHRVRYPSLHAARTALAVDLITQMYSLTPRPNFIPVLTKETRWQRLSPFRRGRLTSPKAPLPSSTFWPRASRWIRTSSGRSAGSLGADETAASLLLVSSAVAFGGW